MKKYIKKIILIYCAINITFFLFNCDPAWNYKLDNKKSKKVIYNTKKLSKKPVSITVDKNKTLYIRYNLKGFNFSGSCGFADSKKNNFAIVFDVLNNKKPIRLVFKKY